MPEVNVDNLFPSHKGLRLASNQAKMIWQGNKKLVVSDKSFPDSVGKLFYVVGGNDAYSVVQVKGVNMIGLSDFEKLHDQHMISEEERNLWWIGKQKLFAYEFEVVKHFEVPEKVSNPEDKELFGEVNFVTDLAEREKELSKLRNDYNPSQFELSQLMSDFKIVLAWNEIEKYSSDEIIPLAKKIKDELETRKVSFNKEKLSKATHELFEIISKGETSFKGFVDFCVLKDSVLVLEEPTEDSKEINFIIKLDEPEKSFQNVIESRILRSFDENKVDKVKFEWTSKVEKFKEAIPVYDLVLRKKEVFDKTKLTKDNVSLMKPFEPMFAVKKFNSVSKLTEYLYG